MPKMVTVKRALYFLIPAILGILIWGWGVLPQPGHALEITHLFFYDPTSPWQNMTDLEGQLKGYLMRDIPGIIISAYDDYDYFTEDITYDKPEFLLVFGFHYDQLHKQPDDHFPYCPIAIATSKNKTTSTFVVVTHSPDDTLNSHIGDYLATLNFGALTDQYLYEYFLKPNGLESNNFRIIKTSKDIDSLFALSENQVALSVVKQNQFEFIATVNSWVVDGMAEIATAEVPNLVLCGLPGNSPDINRKMVALLQNMQVQRPDILDRLGYDGWKRYNESVSGMDQQSDGKKVDGEK